MPAEASDTLGQYSAILNGPILLSCSGPGQCSRIKAVTVHSHRLETVRKPQAALCQTPRPKLKGISLEPSSTWLLFRIVFL